MIVGSAIACGADKSVLGGSEVNAIEENWTVTNDIDSTVIKLDFKNAKSTKMGFKANAKYTFNQKITSDSINDCLVFESNRTNVWVYVDGTEVYNYNPQLPNYVKAPTAKWNIADISSAHVGSDIDVVLQSSIDADNIPVYVFYSTTSEDAIYYVVQKSAFSLACSAAILAIGILIFALYFAAKKKDILSSPFLYLGIGVVLFSLFSMADNSVPELYFGHLVLWDTIKYMCLAVAAAFFALSFITEFGPLLNEKKSKVGDGLHVCLRIAFWTTVGSLILQVVLQFIGIDFVISSVINFPVYLILFGLISAIAIYLYVTEKSGANLYRIIVKVGALTLIFIATILIFVSDAHVANQFLRIAILFYSIGAVGHLSYQLFDETKKRLVLSEELSTMKANAIVHQIRPDFLISALDDIKTICMVSPNRASDSLDSYSIYLTSNLKTLSKRPFIKFSQELEHIKSYLDIIQFKNGNKIKVVYDSIEQTFLVPPVTIELFVESAVRNGILKKYTGGQIEISAWSDDENFYVEIVDDGIGYDVEALDDRLGILTAKARLEKDCKADVSIKSSLSEGTTVKITLPKAFNFSLRSEQRKEISKK